MRDVEGIFASADKIIGKPYAGNPHVRLKGGRETGPYGHCAPDYQWISVTWSILLRAARPELLRSRPRCPYRPVGDVTLDRPPGTGPWGTAVRPQRDSDRFDRPGDRHAGGCPADSRRGPAARDEVAAVLDRSAALSRWEAPCTRGGLTSLGLSPTSASITLAWSSNCASPRPDPRDWCTRSATGPWTSP